MSKELVVSSNRHETRLAILEDDRLVEIYIERRANHAIAGSIYKGRVSRVLPGMQSAFVKLGLARDAFLYVSDVLDKTSELEEGDDPDLADTPSRQSSSGGDRGERGRGGRRRGERSGSRRRGGRRQEAETTGGGSSNDGDGSAKPDETNAASGEDSEDSRRSDGRRSRRRGRRRRGRRGQDGERESSDRDVAPEAREAARDDDRDSIRDRPRESAREDDEREADEAPVEVTSARDGEDFAVLPGESLAKYRSDDEESSDESDDDETEEEATNEYDDSEYDDDSQSEDDDEDSEYEDEDDDDGDGDDDEDAESDSEESSEDDDDVADDEQEDEDEDLEDVEFDDDVEDEAEDDVADDMDGEEEPDSSEEGDDSSETEDNSNGDEPDEPESDEPEKETQAADSGSDEHPIPGEPQVDDPNDAPEVEASVRSGSESAGFQRRGRRGRRRGRGRGWRDDDQREATSSDAPRAEKRDDRGDESPSEALPSDGLPNIRDLLDPGQELIVQIAKEPLGKKGARITSHVALPGRFMVYMPTVNHNGVSRKIHSDSERARLRRVVKEHAEGKPGGFIVRTAGRGATDEELQADLEFLYKQWQGITEKAAKRKAPVLLYHDLDVVERVMRDQLGQNYKTIWVDGEEEYERVLRFVERFQPDLLDRVKLYTRSTPIYDEFNISQEIEKALRPKVWLKSGGYLVINQTEALVAIDVNTGKYVGKSDRLEDTILKTNMEAAEEVVRQMRLRDLGGIIIVDFIDMEDRKNRHNVHQTLENALRRDRAPSKALPFNDFGLIAITRKRVKQSLERALCMPCPTCTGSGTVKSVQTVVGEILNDSRKMKVDPDDHRDVILRVHPEVAKVLKARSNTHLQELEDTLKANVLVRGDVELNPEQYNFH